LPRTAPLQSPAGTPRSTLCDCLWSLKGLRYLRWTSPSWWALGRTYPPCWCPLPAWHRPSPRRHSVITSTRVGSYSICCRPRGGAFLDSSPERFLENPISCLRLVGCDTAAVRVTCLVALAYANGAIDDRADKGNLHNVFNQSLFHSIAITLRRFAVGAARRQSHQCTNTLLGSVGSQACASSTVNLRAESQASV
jgi:hypothetical protein